ncbi:hypothetical protein [Flavobacterium orientale]|uniref:Uncharacterized protein n=1 Tax=Flavobacterium orientale TaxID=1756020 RepID=A0A916Y4F3_9FLAO|nr:hypothetical protein [Flavobacterium orientale]GGD30235.1 hypothetical protein GCM10011343_20540 [Flavobacterium orientale]
MRKFIKKIVLFFAFFILINAIIYFLFINDTHNDYNDFNKNGSVYLMADSHGEALKKYPDDFGIVNFSYESDSYFDIERKLNFLIKETNIKKIVISIDNHCFSNYRENINNIDKSIYFESVCSDNASAYENFKNKYIRYYFPVFNSNSPTIIKIDIFKMLSNRKQGSANLKNWNSLTESEKTKQSISRLEVQFESKKNSQKLLDHFAKIISIANKNKVEIIAIKFPISKNYYKNLMKFDSLNVDHLLKDKKIKIIDFQKVYFDNDTFFSDADHLNDIGGLEFSKLLNDSINKSKNSINHDKN